MVWWASIFSLINRYFILWWHIFIDCCSWFNQNLLGISKIHRRVHKDTFSNLVNCSPLQCIYIEKCMDNLQEEDKQESIRQTRYNLVLQKEKTWERNSRLPYLESFQYKQWHKDILAGFQDSVITPQAIK